MVTIQHNGGQGQGASVTLRKYLKYCLLAFGLLISSGFRIAQSNFGTPMRWNISKEKPVIWVDVCDTVRSISFDVYEFPHRDPLEYSYPSADDIISSVFADYNNNTESFVELRWARDEYFDPVRSKAPNMRYNDQDARYLTINVCNAATSFEAVGHATTKSNEELCADQTFKDENSNYCRQVQVASCTIALDSSYIARGANLFTHVLTHEIGHCLGLMHNHETALSVMSYVHDQEKTIRLQADDKMGLSFLYPSDPKRSKQSIDFGLAACVAKP